MMNTALTAPSNAEIRASNLAHKRKLFGHDWWQRYRDIFIMIAFFLIIDASVFIINFYISYRMSEDAISVDLAGRQRTLSQRISKSLLEINYSLTVSFGDQEGITRSIDELDRSRELFDRTLHAFAQGATTLSSDTQESEVFLPAVKNETARNSVAQTQALWSPFNEMLQTLIAGARAGQLDRFFLMDVAEYSVKNNVTILNNMNTLTGALVEESNKLAHTLRLIQMSALLLALLNFIFIVRHFMHQLRRSDLKIAKREDETKQIMQTIREGLFLLDHEQNIAEQYSRELENILQTNSISSRSLTDVLQGMIEPKLIQHTSTFVKQLFNPGVLQDLITDINPLKQAHIYTYDPQGRTRERYLNFQFNRVYENEQITGVLVLVRDITQEIVLEQRVAEEREESEHILDILGVVLKIDSSVLNSFIVSSKKRLESINLILKSPDKTPLALRKKCRDLFRETHSMKGDASALELRGFTHKAELLEEEIKKLQDQKSLAGDDFLALTIILNELFEFITLIEDLEKRLNHAHMIEAKTQNAPQLSMQEHLAHFVQSMAQRNQKNIRFSCQGWDLIPADKVDVLKDISIQLLRNAVVHGIENEEERLLHPQKDPQGHIQLTIERNAEGLTLSVEDDGNGINFEKIRRKALESALASETEISHWDNKKLLSLIFQSGFSTATHATEDAGKGVGLDVIAERVKEIGGRLSIQSTAGVMSRFSIKIPC